MSDDKKPVVGHYASHPSEPQRVGSIEASTVMYVTKDAYDALAAELAAVKAERDELIRRLEPSEPTYESALGEIDYLHDLEQMVGKGAIANQTLRRANEALVKVLEAIQQELVPWTSCRDAWETSDEFLDKIALDIENALATAGGAKERGE